MRKRIGAIFMAAAMIFISSFTVRAEKSVGVIGGVTTNSPAPVAGLYFGLGIIPHMRITPSVVYVFPHRNLDAFMLNINLESPWSLTGSRFKVYPLAGLNISRWNKNRGKKDAESNHYDRIGFNVGGGVEWRPSPLIGLKIFAEGKYVYGRNFDTGLVNLGIGYEF